MRRSGNVKNMSPKMQFFFARFFPLPFILVGAITLYFGFQNVIRSKQSTEWPTVKGVVKHSSVDYSRSDKGSGTYQANVQYEFTIDGTEYVGDEVAYGDFGSSDSSRAHKISRKYPVGKEVTVFYLPEDPYECVLEPGLKMQAWFLPGFGMIFFVVGTAMFIFLPKLMKSSGESNEQTAETSSDVSS